MARIITFLLLFASVLPAEIIETNRMDRIMPYINENTWVVFDIDDTLLESELQYGRSRWVYFEINRMVEQGFDKAIAIERLDQEGLSIPCPMRLTEPQIPSLIKEVQRAAGAVMALTSRPPRLSEITFRLFSQTGIDLSTHAPASSPLNAHYEKGVLFASIMNSKGTIFRQFIERSETRPGKIVFIDDLMHHVLDMEKEMTALGIPYLGVHYVKTLERPFDPELAEIERRRLLEGRDF